MANEAHLAILQQGVEVWNAWREQKHEPRPDLSEANLIFDRLVRVNLSGVNLEGAELKWANLVWANLERANLERANLEKANLIDTHLQGVNLIKAILNGADLSGAELKWANLSEAKLKGANLAGANLENANLTNADLSNVYLAGTNLTQAKLVGASLKGAYLSATNLSGADLSKTDFTSVSTDKTMFNNNDLSTIRGLDTVRHRNSSSVSIDTLIRSQGKIPEVFLRGCGVPDTLIEYLPSLIGAMEPIQFYSCFISHSSKDDNFANRLYQRLQAEHLRVWFAPHDIQGGKKFLDQIDEAIRVYDKTLLVLSEYSLKSPWVITELRKAYKAELQTRSQKLFPIRLVDMDVLKGWECIDVDTGEDLALYLRGYHIPDFSHWKEHDAFEAAFANLLRDLRSAEKSKPENGSAIPD